MRLSRPEVKKIAEEGYVEEHTLFGQSTFIYALQAVNEGYQLSAAFEKNKITMFVPKSLLSDWPENNVVGFDASMPLNEKDNLFLLLEKDFACLDATTEDQSDNYANPNKKSDRGR